MKFGDTLHERSVPKWASYNLNYNDLKRLIKLRTTTGAAVPTPIPGRATASWSQLDEELFNILRGQYANIGLFLRSKHGEIDRRLAYLERQVRSAQRSLSLQQGSRSLQARRYQKLVNEADEISDDIQALSRFTAVQKTGFRKILKKYRKWTGSTTLQARLDNDVFSDGQLQLDHSELMRRLSSLMSILTEQLHAPMLKGQPSKSNSRTKSISQSGESAVHMISEAQKQSSLYFDAAFASTPFGEAAGSATYWIHPDNLEEIKVLLARYMQYLSFGLMLSENLSTTSIDSQTSAASNTKADDPIHVLYFDNVQRLIQDHNTNKPSRAALSARWGHIHEAVVTLSDLARSNPVDKILCIKQKSIVDALDRDASIRKDKVSQNATNMRSVQDFLQKHRDVKPIAEVHCRRARLAGSTNSLNVGSWATLDTEITLSPAVKDHIGDRHPDVESGEAFPHAVLEIRWEFGPRPEIVHTLDASHLAERVLDFTLETAAVYSQNKELPPPTWTDILTKDIRKVPVSRDSISKSKNVSTGTVSGPSSTDGGTDSVFSMTQGHSTAPSEVSVGGSPIGASSSTFAKPSTKDTFRSKKKKKTRINARSPERSEVRYYSEYDDPNSELNLQESYAIYVDPEQEDFPGAETISKAFSSMYQSFGRGTSKVLSWLPLVNRAKSVNDPPTGERTPLLFGTQSWQHAEEGPDSSDSDSSPTATDEDRKYVKGSKSRKKGGKVKSTPIQQPRMSRRQREQEQTLLHFYTGLIILGYILLLMSGMLLATGRKKAVLEVDVGAIVGIVAAEVCALMSGVLILMRRTKLSVLHWGTTCVAITGVAVIGIGLLVSTIARLS